MDTDRILQALDGLAQLISGHKEADTAAAAVEPAAPAGVANEAPPVDLAAPGAVDQVVDQAAAVEAPAPAVVDQAPAAAAAPAGPVNVPAPGEVCRYTSYDAYADPPRNREQLVLVTGRPFDGTGAVHGVSLGYAEAVEASFRPEDLQPA